MRFVLSLTVTLAVALGGCSLFSPDHVAERHRSAVDEHAAGLSLEEAGRWEEASLAHQRSLSITETPAAHVHLGICQMEMGDLHSAASHMRRALELSPSYALAETHLLEIEALREMEASEIDDTATPVPVADSPLIAQREQEMPTVDDARAVLFPHLHGDSDAPSGAVRLREGNLHSPEFHLAQALGFEREGDNLSALREYRTAFDRDPSRTEALLGAARLRVQMGHEAEAMSLWERAATIDPDNPTIPLQVGNHHFRQGRAAEAATQYERVIDLNPRHLQALNNLGAALREQGKLDESLVPLERALEINPHYAPPHRNIGNVRAEQGNERAALEAYREYVRLGGSQADEVSRWIREIELRLGE